MRIKKGTQLFFAVLILLVSGVVAACENDPSQLTPDDPVLLSVIPQGGAVGIDVNSSVTIRFSHSMMPGMEEYADVHEGHVEGPLVKGTWTWNDTFTELTFSPDAPLKPQTDYVIHLGGGMEDQEGRHLNFQQHGFGMGGEWMTQQMHQGGQHGYGTGHGGMGGMGSGTGMGQGWVHPGNGGYGMTFTFTTA